MRHPALRLAGVVLTVTLLVIPLVASAHTHRDLGTARSCATCVAAHQSAVVSTPAIGSIGSPIAATALLPPAEIVPAGRHRSPRAGRAPPIPTPVSVG